MTKRVDIVSDPTFLTAALEGLEFQKRRIEEQIQQVRKLLRQKDGADGHPAALALPSSSRGRRTLSPEGRKRIGAAQKKRWSEFRKAAADKKK